MKNAKILIVDDDPDLTKALKATLESKNYIVITASDGSKGMDKINADKPDLLILDVIMSTSQDGFEMARELKKDPQLKKMPILMLTAIKGRTGIDFKSSAGDANWLPVDSFLDKPVEPEVLLAEIKRLLSPKT
jgi:two-component system alkaline phosphatase synthesis response regulator PhoP